MAERLKFKKDEIDSIIKKITELIYNCNNISKLNIKADDILDKETIKTITKPTIKIPASIYIKMLQLIHEYSVEISWHGLVKRDIENQIYTIYDILLFPQINTATSTTTEQDEFAKWTEKLILDPKFPIQDLRMHGHSHVNMNVFSSAVDDTYQNDILTKVEDDDYYIFLIMNKRNEICVLLYDYHQQILFTTGDIDIIITDENDNDIKLWAKDQIKKYCKEEKPYYNKGTYRGYQTHLSLDIYNDDSEKVFIKDAKVKPKQFSKKAGSKWT